jgi:hypothetical protein
VSPAKSSQEAEIFFFFLLIFQARVEKRGEDEFLAARSGSSHGNDSSKDRTEKRSKFTSEGSKGKGKGGGDSKQIDVFKNTATKITNETPATALPTVTCCNTSPDMLHPQDLALRVFKGETSFPAIVTATMSILPKVKPQNVVIQSLSAK